MNQDKVPFFSLIVFITLSIIACKGTIDPVGIEGEYDYVAVTARINDERQIILVDYNDPAKFKQITFNDHQNIDPKFSHDRTKLVFQDLKMGFSHDHAIVYYNVNTGYLSPIHIDTLDDGYKVPLVGDFVVWDLSDNSFFMRLHPSWGISTTDIGKYDLIDSEWSRITNTSQCNNRPISVFDENTLIIYTNNDATNEPPGHYLFNIHGTYQGRINNPHFEMIWREGITYKGIRNPEYNYRNGLFAFAYFDSTLDGYKIAASNLGGPNYTDLNYNKPFSAWESTEYRSVHLSRSHTR